MKTPILGSAYVARSINAANNRMVNLFPEIVPDPEGKEPAFLNRAPGLSLLTSELISPIRGLNSFGGKLFTVSGTKLYSLNTSYVTTELGTITGSGPVSMANNGTQLMIATGGTAGTSYIYNNSTNVFTQVTDVDFPGAVTVGYLDGYFVINKPTSREVWTSASLDGTSWDAAHKATFTEINGDIVALVDDHREIWLFGNENTQVLFNDGATGFPLAVIQAATIEVGCAAVYSIAKLDNSLFWLGRDSRGNGIVYRANGYTPQRVSTHAVEWQIQEYSDMSDAIGYSYQQDGHFFYVLTFPTGNATWVYDASTQTWHERAWWNVGTSKFNRHRGNAYAFFNNKHIIGDWENGDLYAFDLTVYRDSTDHQRWLRSWRALPTGKNNLKRSVHHSLQLDCKSGVGVTEGVGWNSGQGSDPQVMLRWSDDAGHTWSNEHWAGMGKIGTYETRVNWHRLGATMRIRDRIYEVSGTDPVEIIIMGAELIASGTDA